MRIRRKLDNIDARSLQGGQGLCDKEVTEWVWDFEKREGSPDSSTEVVTHVQTHPKGPNKIWDHENIKFGSN